MGMNSSIHFITLSLYSIGLSQWQQRPSLIGTSLAPSLPLQYGHFFTEKHLNSIAEIRLVKQASSSILSIRKNRIRAIRYTASAWRSGAALAKASS